MVVRFPVVLLFLRCAIAQFFSLATPSDGSRVYFETPLRQKNTLQPAYGKLFRVDSAGLSLQESRVQQNPAPSPGTSLPVSNAYDLQGVDVSSDGLVIAAAAIRDCIEPPLSSNKLCGKGVEAFITTITTDGHSQDYHGNLRLSANGEWAFGAGSGLPFYSSIPYGYIVNLTTGEEQPQKPSVARFTVASAGRIVANDGTAVFSDQEAVVILQRGQMRRVPTQNHDLPGEAVIDAGAHTIVYSVTPNISPRAGAVVIGGNKSLYVANAATGESMKLASDGYAPSMSDDGRQVFYLSQRDGAPQVWMINTDGSDERKLTNDPLGIARAVLSGDGTMFYAVTLGGQLLKAEVGSGQAQELIPRTPFIDPAQFTAPGKLVTLTGQGLSDSVITAAPPLPYVLGDIQITIQGKLARMLSVHPTAVTLLVPPDVTSLFPYTAPMEVAAPSPSPFAGPVAQVRMVDYAPQFLFSGRPIISYMLAAHEDWGTLVTADNPARPNEVLHAYATGLGPTTPAVAYGAAAPSQEPLARVIAGYHCAGPYASTTSQQVEILFEGLAPTLAGIYQIDWRVPADAPTGDYGIYCQIPNGGPNFSGIVPLQR